MVIRQLEYLVALAREKHFARAAEACRVSQPALSTALRQLEEELQVPIVERGHRFQGFTREGALVLEWAKKILADRDGLAQELAMLQQGLAGKLRIGAVPSALPIVSLITSPFAQTHPAVTVSVLSQTSIQIEAGLENFEIDVGVTYLDNEPLRHVRSLPLYQEDYILLMPAGQAPPSRRTIRWVEAAELPLCLLTPTMQNRRIIDGIFRSVGCSPRAAVETDSIINLCSHVRGGFWSSVMPRALLHLFGVPAGTRALRLVEPEATRTMGLVMTDRDPPSPLARGLFDTARMLDLDAELQATPLHPAF
jgi:DNA-binding transcriptional LysR family regulator